MNPVKKLIPDPIKQRIRIYRENKRKVQLFGELASLVPPVKCMFDGPQSLEAFKANGDEFFRIYQDICGLKPDETMLDVGSGIGRKTLPLTQYLNQQAQYEGIDVTKAGVEWCREKISAKFTNFRFQHIDVYNKLYNPNGSLLSTEYQFPFADESFSFVMLGSVFTHMLPDDLRHYLSQVHRVLKKKGRCLISYFLLNEESVQLIEEGKSTLDFKHSFQEYRVVSRETPEEALAFDQQWIEELYRNMDFEIKRVDYGSWCGRGRYLSFQDLFFAVKR